MERTEEGDYLLYPGACFCDPRRRRILVTGVVNRHSIAFAIAAAAQREGAEVVLTSFGRMRRMTERAAAAARSRLPT